MGRTIAAIMGPTYESTYRRVYATNKPNVWFIDVLYVGSLLRTPKVTRGANGIPSNRSI